MTDMQTDYTPTTVEDARWRRTGVHRRSVHCGVGATRTRVLRRPYSNT